VQFGIEGLEKTCRFYQYALAYNGRLRVSLQNQLHSKKQVLRKTWSIRAACVRKLVEIESGIGENCSPTSAATAPARADLNTSGAKRSLVTGVVKASVRSASKVSIAPSAKPCIFINARSIL
jgi:hypothetical protein